MNVISAAGAPANSEAFYDAGMKSPVGYSDLSKNRLMGKFAHEGTHQFCHMYFRDMGKLPKWFGEGIAECFGSFERKGSKIQLCRLKPFFARSNLYDLQQAIRRGNLPSLETLVVRANDNEFDAMGRLGYSFAWSFCHFLLAFPVQEATSMVVPDGKYAWNLKQYIEKLREKGATAAQAVEAGFSKTKDGTPWDWKKIEAEWKKYILGMKVRLADFAFEELLPEYESLAWKQSTAGKYVAARSNAPEAATQKALDTIDGVFESLMRLFKIPPDKVKAKEPIRLPVLMLFDDRAAFQTAGFSPNEVSGFRGKYLYTFQRELFEIELIMSATDQFLELYVPNPEQLPPWVRWGLSQCMATGEIKDKRWAPCLQKTPMGAHLRRQLAQLLTQGKAQSVADVRPAS